MFQIYILYSELLNRYYIGYTEGSAEARLNKHLSNHKGFTSKAKDWSIVHIEEFPEKQQAIQRERQLKSWKNAERITQLIKRSSTE